MSPGDEGLRVFVDGAGSAGFPPGWVESAVRHVLAEEGVEAAELSLTLLDDPAIRALNRRHLGHDRPTDVLAFALWEEGEPVVGDIYVGLDQARRQAASEGVTVEEEVVRLAVHGVLHVLGWDHPEEADDRPASPMYRRQEALMAEVLAR